MIFATRRTRSPPPTEVPPNFKICTLVSIKLLRYDYILLFVSFGRRWEGDTHRTTLHRATTRVAPTMPRMKRLPRPAHSRGEHRGRPAGGQGSSMPLLICLL